MSHAIQTIVHDHSLSKLIAYDLKNECFYLRVVVDLSALVAYAHPNHSVGSGTAFHPDILKHGSGLAVW